MRILHCGLWSLCSHAKGKSVMSSTISRFCSGRELRILVIGLRFGVKIRGIKSPFLQSLKILSFSCFVRCLLDLSGGKLKSVACVESTIARLWQSFEMTFRHNVWCEVFCILPKSSKSRLERGLVLIL